VTVHQCQKLTVLLISEIQLLKSVLLPVKTKIQQEEKTIMAGFIHRELLGSGKVFFAPMNMTRNVNVENEQGYTTSFKAEDLSG